MSRTTHFIAIIDPGTVSAMFDRVQAIGSHDLGFLIIGESSTGGAVNVTIANSVVSSNGTGITTVSATGKANTQVVVSDTVIANNGTGVAEDGPNSTTYLTKNTIAGNTTAFAVTGGSLFSFGDNDIKSNGNDGGAISLVSTK